MRKKLGYIRVSTKEQNIETQKSALINSGVAEDDIFIDHGVSGAKMDRPQLEALLSYAREGDTIVVYKLDRIARSLQGLLEFIEKLSARDIRFESINEAGINTSGPLGTFVTQVLGAAAEFELSLIQSRVREGVRNAQARGVRFGRRPKITKAMREDIVRRVSGGQSRRSVAKDFAISAMQVGRIYNEDVIK